jgi:hypothetical protein
MLDKEFYRLLVSFDAERINQEISQFLGSLPDDSPVARELRDGSGRGSVAPPSR